MLIPTCLFRVGGAAIVLSNKRSACGRAKCARACPVACKSYELHYSVLI